jgi:hypothetical protein
MGSKSPAGNPRLPPMRTYVRRSCCAYVRITSAGAIMAFAEQFLRWAVDGLGESSVCRHVVFSRVVDGLQILRAIERVPTGYSLPNAGFGHSPLLHSCCGPTPAVLHAAHRRGVLRPSLFIARGGAVLQRSLVHDSLQLWRPAQA